MKFIGSYKDTIDKNECTAPPADAPGDTDFRRMRTNIDSVAHNICLFKHLRKKVHFTVLPAELIVKL